MAYIPTPRYYAKILPISGSAFDLEDAGITFTEALRIPTQDNHGSFEIALKNVIDPQNAYLQDTYNQIDYEQRIELYETFDRSGCPAFSGVVTEPPSGDLSRTSIKGEDVTRRLETRRLRRYESFNGNAVTIATSLLSTYNPVFSDDFNRATLGANWSTSGTNASAWSISSSRMQRTACPTDSAMNSANWAALLTAASFGSACCVNAKISFDLRFNDITQTPNYFAFCPVYQLSLGSSQAQIRIQTMPWAAQDLRVGGQNGFLEDLNASRIAALGLGEFMHFDCYIQSASTAGKDVIIDFNCLESIAYNASTMTGSGVTRFSAPGRSVSTCPDYLDNFVFSTKIPAITQGVFDVTTTVFNQVFNGNTQREALNIIADTLGWDYRVNPGSGSGNDTLDFGTDVGRDLSGTVILEEGQNIINVQKRRTNQDLATWLQVYGQSQDDKSVNFSSVNIARFTAYGIVESVYNDPRITDSSIAKLLGDNRLAILSVGNVSLSGTIIDESILFTQDPRWGYFVWGDMIYGGRQKLRPGDQVWMKVPRLNIDKKVTVISLRRTSGTHAIEVIFDYFPWRKTDAYKETMRQLEMLQIALANLMNAQGVHLILSGTTAQTWSFYLRGNQITNVYVDITSNAWAGAVTVTIDGTDRTNALFGSATLTADAHANDTAYLVMPGVHTIAITPTVSVTVDISIKTKVLS